MHDSRMVVARTHACEIIAAMHDAAADCTVARLGMRGAHRGSKISSIRNWPCLSAKVCFDVRSAFSSRGDFQIAKALHPGAYDASMVLVLLAPKFLKFCDK